MTPASRYNLVEMRLFLGVDGGQSSTKAVIGDEAGNILGCGTGGPCNHAGAGEGRARLECGIAETLASACREAGLDPRTVAFEAACFGMSGGPDDKEAILSQILRAGVLLVTNDAAIALAGATAGGCGVIVIAGTGSIASGRNGDGRRARAGGWGYQFGDEGSGFDIVRHALRASLRMEEGWGPPTGLRRVLQEATATASANETLHLFYTDRWPRERVAALAPLVDAAAREGDAAAIEILNRAAQELALSAGAVRAQLWKTGDAVEIAYVGGVFRSEILLNRFRLLVEMEPGNSCVAPRRSPAEGALLEACRAAGLETRLR
jgi:N-acetylglucosamine kinase-like BadF-type ATPase